MKIEIQNIGPIKKTQLDLSKELTLFCGPNNSGKTYVAFIIYALTKASHVYVGLKDKTLIEDLLIKKIINLDIDYDTIWWLRIAIQKRIKESLDSIYGISKEVVDDLFHQFGIKVIETQEEFIKNLRSQHFEVKQKLKDITINISKQEDTDIINLYIDKQIPSKGNIAALEFFLNTRLHSTLAFYPFTGSYILPVERNSIYTFSKELSIKKQELLERIQEKSSNVSPHELDLLIRRSTRYPLPIRDGLKIAEDLANYSKTKGEFYKFAEDIENKLLQGKVFVSKDGEVQFSSEKAKTKKIPIHLAASVVKTLSSLVFYLKYIAKKNDLIIIDEPELNLHPNNQVKLARIFGRLINNGFRLLISTHSDYIIRELNNLIMVSSEKEGIKEVAEKYNYAEDEKLKMSQVGVYFFNYKNKSSKTIEVKPIEITETGFDVSSIDETIDNLNEVSEDLFYTLKYGVAEDE